MQAVSSIMFALHITDLLMLILYGAIVIESRFVIVIHVNYKKYGTHIILVITGTESLTIHMVRDLSLPLKHFLRAGSTHYNVKTLDQGGEGNLEKPPPPENGKIGAKSSKSSAKVKMTNYNVVERMNA